MVGRYLSKLSCILVVTRWFHIHILKQSSAALYKEKDKIGHNSRKIINDNSLSPYRRYNNGCNNDLLLWFSIWFLLTTTVIFLQERWKFLHIAIIAMFTQDLWGNFLYIIKWWERWQPTNTAHNTVSNKLSGTTLETPRCLSGLELARYVLRRLTENADSIGTLTPAFDGDEKFVSSIVSFLEDIGWMIQQPTGRYVITDKGKNEEQWYDRTILVYHILYLIRIKDLLGRKNTSNMSENWKRKAYLVEL